MNALHAPKALDKIKELYKFDMTQRQIAEHLNELKKKQDGYGPKGSKWSQEKVSLYARRAGLSKFTKKAKKKAAPNFIDLPMHTPAPKENQKKLMVIICTQSQIKNILEELQ